MSNYFYSLAELASLSGVSLTLEQWEQIQSFQEFILEENKKLNLTAITDPRQFTNKHIIDSLAPALLWKNSLPKTLIDVGTGAGFPGFVLGLAFPQIEITLVESIHKKAAVLSYAKALFGCENISVVSSRAESLNTRAGFFGQFDISIARAVAPLNRLLPILAPFITKNGSILAMKGQKAGEELQEAKEVIQKLSLRHTQSHAYTLPDESTPRTIMVFQYSR